MTKSMDKMMNLVEKEMELHGEYHAIEKLKECGLEHDKACGFVEVLILKKNHYYSYINRFKRFLGATDISPEGLYKFLCTYLISKGDYKSIEDIEKRILEQSALRLELEDEYNYRDDLYYFSSNTKRKIIILVNLHFSELSSNLQNAAISLLGKDKLAKSINDRTKYLKN